MNHMNSSRSFLSLRVLLDVPKQKPPPRLEKWTLIQQTFMRYGDTDPTKVQSLTLESTRWLHHRTEPLVNWQGYCKLVSTRALSHLTETTRINRLSKDFNVLITLITLILHELTTQMIFLECLLKQDDIL